MMQTMKRKNNIFILLLLILVSCESPKQQEKIMKHKFTKRDIIKKLSKNNFEGNIFKIDYSLHMMGEEKCKILWEKMKYIDKSKIVSLELEGKLIDSTINAYFFNYFLEGLKLKELTLLNFYKLEKLPNKVLENTDLYYLKLKLAGLKELNLNKLKNLEYLIIRDRSFLTNLELDSLKKIKHLDLDDAHQLKKLNLKNLEKLEILRINSCRLESTIEMPKKMNFLKEFHISFSKKEDIETILSQSEMPNLEKIYLCGCSLDLNISYLSLNFDKFKNLKYLYIKNKMSNMQIEMLKKKYPKLEIIDEFIGASSLLKDWF